MSLLVFKKIIIHSVDKSMFINDRVDKLTELQKNANKTFTYSKKSTITSRLVTVKGNIDLLSIVQGLCAILLWL